MLIIFLVILLDLIGFGIMIPILAYYVLQMGGGPEMATFTMALYAFGMFFATPVLGRLSDYYGRKPVLALSMLGAILGYLILAFADSVWIICLSRLVSGLMAGNLSAAQAYITDITSEENRAKGMGVIGAAFGLGFIVGPALGSYLAGDSFENANLFLPAITSAVLSALALVTIVFFLPESLDKDHRDQLRMRPKVSQLKVLRRVGAQPLLFQFLIGGLIYNVGAGFVESIFPLWIKDTGIAEGPRDLIALLLTSGLIMVAIQGGGVGPLTRKFGEFHLFKFGALLFGLSMMVFVLVGSQSSYVGAMLALGLQSAAAALLITSMQSLVSMCAEPTERGMVMGVYSSAGTLGRALGTVLTGLVFAKIHIHAPYLITCLIMIALFFVASRAQAKWFVAKRSNLAVNEI